MEIPCDLGCFQFLGIPPKGELLVATPQAKAYLGFPISRDPPEGGTLELVDARVAIIDPVSNF